MQLVIFFLLLTKILFSDPYTTAITENDPSTFIDGVSMITGDFYLGEEDYTVAGAEPIPLRRFYLSQGNTLEEQPHLHAVFRMGSQLWEIHAPESNGTVVIYGIDLQGKKHLPWFQIGDDFYHKKREKIYRPCDFLNTAKGISNTATGVMSAKTQLKNQTIVFHPKNDPKGKSFTLYAADGTIRRYSNDAKQEKEEYNPGSFYVNENALPERYENFTYHLIEEKLPNGHHCHYQWDKKNQLVSIRTTNARNTKTFARVTGAPHRRNDPEQTREGSDGRKLRCLYNKTLKTVFSPEHPDQHLTYENEEAPRPLLNSIALPNGRKIAIQYDNTPERKVSALLAPLGKDNTLIPYYTFFYDLKAKNSHATDLLGNRTTYFWNDDLRIQRIDHFAGKDGLQSSETFIWDGPNLHCKAVHDTTRALLFARTFVYDERGNVLEETLWGDLSGQSSPLHLGAKGFPRDDGIEKAVIKNTYSSDGRNLLLRREEPNGLIAEYTYLKEAQLPQTKTLSYRKDVLSRVTDEYDVDLILIREITEDGPSRTIQQITPRQAEPYIGLADWTEEKYWDGSKEVLLRKTKLHYTHGANIAQKDIYDANGAFRYSLFYTYDGKGRVLEETNAIGQKAVHRYDEVGNRVYTKDFSGRLETFYIYDVMNRLTQKIEQGSDGVRRECLYAYDQKSRLIAETDPYGNTTRYSYDACDRRIETTQPSGAVFRSVYDSVGNEILKIDAEGNETHFTYNVRGQPIRIVHADGAVETSLYNLDGTLKEQVDALGVKTACRYGGFGHVVEKSLFSQQGELLSTESFIYQGNFLIAHTNAEGITTYIGYDGAGRKIAEEAAGERVVITYDECGRIRNKIEGDLVTYYVYDLLDRVIEERQGDARVVQYQYDAAGNRSASIRSVMGQPSIERMEYDSLGRLTKQIDPLEHVTTTVYGEKVFQKTSTDPLGLQIIENFDAQGRLAFLEKRKDNKTLLKEEFSYDRNGNKILQVETVPLPIGGTRQSSIRWKYDNRNRVITLIEADTKVTRYEYNLRGERVVLHKPDGVSLQYTNNPLGHLISLRSSDGTVNHQMIYNHLGQLLTFDGIERTLDARGRVLKEQFPQGFCIQSSYDSRGRKVGTSLPQSGLAIAYQYGPLDLEVVKCGALVHRYVSYDLSGNLRKKELVGGVGTATYQYDLLSRTTTLQAPHFCQSVEAFDAMGNIVGMTVRGEVRRYTYDELYQLTSESGSFAHSYVNDALYNRLQKDGESFEVNALNQLIGVFEYEPNGNPIRVDGMRLFYDALDRLIRVEGVDFTETFTYDFLNRCLSKTTQGKTQKFLYDGQNEIGSLNDRGELREFRVLGATPHAEIGAAVAVWLQGNWYAPVHDLQGNVTALLPLNGEKLTEYSYSAFDEEKVVGLAPNPWRFASKRTDELTGFVNYGRRYYLPKWGRWLNCDPLGFTAGVNLYAFVKNDPLTILDEYGLVDESSWSQRFWASQAYEKSRVFMSNALANPRVQGTMQAFGGLAEVGIGAGITGATGGFGGIAGLGVAVHGFDQFYAGLRTVCSGRYQAPVCAQLLQRAGMSGGNAALANDCLSLGGTMGGTMLCRARQWTSLLDPGKYRMPKGPLSVEDKLATARVPSKESHRLMYTSTTTNESTLTALYRAVQPVELADIQKTGIFRNLGNAEGKYFTTSIEGASSYAKKAVTGFGDPPYTLVRTQIPNHVLNGISPTLVDGGIPAWVVHDHSLGGLIPEIMTWMSVPK